MTRPFAFPVAPLVFVASAFGASAVMAQDELCGAYPVGSKSYTCTCTPDAAVGSVWGSGPYTADSNLCTAAIHAGVLGFDGGTVVAIATGEQMSFSGSEANGVVSGDWGSYPNSFFFDMPVSAAEAEMVPVVEGEVCGPYPKDAESYVCACPAGSGGGGVWGSSPYTADSHICTAALHGGLIGPEGGMVMTLRTAGLESYFGSDINGVTSRDWGSYDTSFVFNYN